MISGIMKLVIYGGQDVYLTNDNYYLDKFIEHFNRHCKNSKNLRINSSSFNLKIEFYYYKNIDAEPW